MDFSWVSALNDLVVIGGTVGGAVFAHKKGWFSLVVHVIEDKGAQIVQDVKNVAHGVGQLSPAAAAAEHALKQEVDHVTAQFREAEVTRLALAGLHGIGQSYNALSDAQKTALSIEIANRLPADWNVTAKEIAAGLKLAQNLSEGFATAPVIMKANDFTAELQNQTAATAEVAQ